jgi:hypothetical protein
VSAQVAFLSFAQVTDPAGHRPYNAWHQLDHRPENLALEGVRWGERWVRTPACARRSPIGDPRLAGTHYVNMYWFREPWRESFAEWQELAERSFQWGRRPDTTLALRPLMGLFRAIRGYASPRVLISPEALPFRPARAVHLTLRRFEDAHSPDVHAHHAAFDTDVAPGLLDRPGVAGLWTFTSMATTLDASWRAVPGSTTFEPSGSDAGRLRAELLFLDGDPDLALPPPAPGPGEVLFASRLLPITPWGWDWFDGPT